MLSESTVLKIFKHIFQSFPLFKGSLYVADPGAKEDGLHQLYAVAKKLHI
jgi:hypothetical protein